MLYAKGNKGCAFIVTLVANDIHPDAFLAVTLYVPDATPVNIPVVLVYVVPLILYDNPDKTDVCVEVTVIVPVVTLQVGCVTVTFGAAGAEGIAFTVTLLAAEIQPDAFFAVKL